jgi:hypothetical protein
MKNLGHYVFNMVAIGLPTFLLLDIEENGAEDIFKITTVLFFLIIRFTNLEIKIGKLEERD